MGADKTLKIYKEYDVFVIERINEFNHATKRSFITKEGLKEGLDAYIPYMEDYDIEVSKNLWALVNNHLSKDVL